uniref:N-substituted formamide deformylase n=1 Tax=Arthrobacter pascens TaxID=1677 RepID=NFDA_ARTPS|nr:RecName: Full=N-substituted formamide deformylase; Flags: Precursor [Arthrobacter pascens]BAD37143.1 N-substituted formamide deformylase [Arthrobacter pascens]
MTQMRDLMIINANVRTVDARNSCAQAVLVSGGRIAIVGTETEVRGAAAPDAEVLDVSGKTVVPGFIDAHNHLSVAAFAPDSVDCSTPPLATLDEVLEVIERHCRNIPPGQWVRGINFHASHIREQRNPTRYELDEVAPNNPFFLIDASCHAGFANSAALDLVGIGAHTPEPWGGEIERDLSGKPTGTLLEAAANLLHSASWNDYAERDWDRAVELLHSKMNDYLAVGLTGVGDAMVTAKSAELYRRADAAGKMPFTLQQLHGGDHFFSMQDLGRSDTVDRIMEPESYLLRGGAMKIFVDRAYPSPAIDQIHDGCKTHVGANFYSKSEVHDLAVRASKLGINLAIHGMGNCAIDIVLDAYEAVRRQSNADTVLRLEHAFIAETGQGQRMADLGIDLVANPGLAFGWGEVFNMWRGENQEHLKLFPVRSMLDAGVRVSLASDHPCGTYSPAEIMWTAVARETMAGAPLEPDEAVTADEALRMYTINPAHASGRGSEEGSIEAGKRANLLVLDRDPVDCATGELRELQVLRTYVDGVLRYERTGS